MEVIRVLHVIAGMGSGGAESYIMNMYRNIDCTKIQFDFLLRSKEIIYAEEIEKLGGKVYYTSEFPTHIIRNYKEVRSFFQKHKEYKIIHVHGNALIYVTALIIAKKQGVKCRIMHSHNIKTRKPVYKIVHLFHKMWIKKWATDYFACSEHAGKWMFHDNYVIRHNAVDVERFYSVRDQRNELKKKYHLENNIVLGHVGRFLPSKNHKFLIELFYHYHVKHPDAVLVLAGIGYLMEEIKQLANQYGLIHAVRFLGERKDMEQVLQLFDVMLLPSLYEGLPVTLIEAQAAGIPCVISSCITDEAILTPLVVKADLNNGVSEWINRIDSVRTMMAAEREHAHVLVKKNGFDSREEARKLQEFYLEK